ncbi:hypothetical protein CQA38_04315 [Campylobacter sp. MIT 12-5580]|uniref:hypothetical protein n=1 Tax=Campylobacter sp. MIT 12-5580 TaxID=2040651 RepID=UPI0010F60280|nr:hypothetical protein [Campylobacter sp. MIT 12-5580]TKX29312.1 hypothetical protein CQA38_04315 [Campylobacter sp. MIT 12-5580]
MIYIYEFLKGASVALMLFGAFYLFMLFHHSFIYLALGALPGFALFVLVCLCIENLNLRKKLEKS